MVPIRISVGQEKERTLFNLFNLLHIPENLWPAAKKVEHRHPHANLDQTHSRRGYDQVHATTDSCPISPRKVTTRLPAPEGNEDKVTSTLLAQSGFGPGPEAQG